MTKRLPRLTKRQRRALQGEEKLLPHARFQPADLTHDQRELLLFLNNCAELGNRSPTTAEVAEGLGWEMSRTVAVLRQARALGMISHEMDGPGARPNDELLAALRRTGLDPSNAERDALVLIGQGASLLPGPERAGFLIGCGLQELREQGHSIANIRKLVLEYLDEGAKELSEQDAAKGAPN